MRSQPVDCLVIGAGPAGLTAALYLRRFGRQVVVVDQGHSRALAIERTHNFPGFPQGVSGHELLRRLREQLSDAGCEVVAAEVASLRRHDRGGFDANGLEQPDQQPHGPMYGQTRPQSHPQTYPQTHPHTHWHTHWHTQTVMLATGVLDAVPQLDGMEALQQHGLLRQCPICDGYEHRGQRIVVLGDGEHAAREADFIAGYSPYVWQAGLTQMPTVRQPGVQWLPALATRAGLSPAGGVRLGLADGSTHDFDIAYAALPAKPRSRLGLALGAGVDAKGNLRVDEHAATSVRGLYAGGDVVQGLDQLVVAAAQGAMAATAIHNLLRKAAG